MTADDPTEPGSGFARLQRANPVPASASFDPSDARPRAILEEILTMPITDSPDTPAPAVPFWKRPAIIGAAAALILVVGVAVATSGGDDDSGLTDAALPINDQPDDDVGAIDEDLFPGGEPATGAPGASSELTSCAVLFSPEELVQRDYAFQGRIVSVAENGETTFDVERWFAGGADAQVTLDAAAMAGSLLDPNTPWGPGAPVLVSGDETFVWSCGFTQLADDFSIPTWEDAFGV